MSAGLPGCPAWPEEFAARYRAAGYWRGETFGALLRAWAARSGEHTAVVDGGSRWSYRELDERAGRLAAGFARLGLRPRDRVVVQLPNTAAFFEVCFGLFRLGAPPVLALPAHRSAEIGAFCAFTDAAAYIIPARHAGYDYRALARQVRAQCPGLAHVIVAGDPDEFTALDDLRDAPADLPEPQPGDVALFQLSGGSTGTPKLIPRTHDDYIYSLRASAEICRLDASSVYLAALPVAHNFPLSSPGALGTLCAGGTVVLARSPSPDETFALIERERVSVTALVPPLAQLWVEAAGTAAADLSSLKLLQVGGARLSPEVARRVRPALGCQLQQVYGMAEGLVCYTRPDDPEEAVLHSQGRPISPDDELRVVDEDGRPVAPGQVGQLLTRGPYTVRGYYRAEQQNAQSFTPDGFYRTGDLVRLRPDGGLSVEGRAKDQINRGGEKIAAAEIEQHLLAHPGVRDAALVALPDPFLGERSCAVVIPRGDPPSGGELLGFLRQRGLAAYKLPDRVVFAESLPRTAVGKVNKPLLVEEVRSKK